MYTDDVYGKTGSRMLQEMAVRERICINTSIVITSDPAVMTSVVSQLIGVRARAKDQSLAVVYIGAKDKAENLVFNLKSQRVGEIATLLKSNHWSQLNDNGDHLCTYLCIYLCWFEQVMTEGDLIKVLE